MVCSAKQWLLLWALSTSIRLITPRQLSRWHKVPVSNAKRTLRRLEAAGFTEEITIRARRLPPIDEPLCRFYPGQPTTPDFGKLSYRAKERFRELPPKMENAYLPTRLTLGQFAAPLPMKLKRSQATHEVGLTEAFIYFFSRWPRLTKRCWRGENLYAHERGHGEKVEDAHFLHPKKDHVMLAIEYAGTYPKSRFEALHESLRHNPYWIM